MTKLEELMDYCAGSRLRLEIGTSFDYVYVRTLGQVWYTGTGSTWESAAADLLDKFERAKNNATKPSGNS